MWQHKQIRQFTAALVASVLSALVGEANYASASPLDAGFEAAYAQHMPDTARYPDRAATAPTYVDLAMRRAAEAKQTRNAVIASWLGQLHQLGLADYSVLNRDRGLIYAVRLKGGADREGVMALWVAVPDGLDLPSSVLLHTPARGAGTAPVLELQSCTARETLAVGAGDMPMAEAETRAVARLNAYLNAPDPMLVTAMGGARDTCRQLASMLPSLAH